MIRLDAGQTSPAIHYSNLNILMTIITEPNKQQTRAAATTTTTTTNYSM